MIFEHIQTGGCQSYLIGCEQSRSALLIDPEISQFDRYVALAARDGLRLHFVIDTHTHADHFTGAQLFAHQQQVCVVMHHTSPAPYVDLRVESGEMLRLGNLRVEFTHTPGHTSDSMCIRIEDKLFTGDTLLIGGTGRTDLPSGDPSQLFDSLFNGLQQLDPSLKVFPAHEYKNRTHSTLGAEFAENPRLQKRDRGEFVEMMQGLNLSMPTHITEALRTNMSGGKSVAQLLAAAADSVPFMSAVELKRRVCAGDHSLIVLDVRERDAFEACHIKGARLLPRGQLELRVNDELPDPTRRIVCYCEFGKVSTLATVTLREMGFKHAVALDSGMQAWIDAGYPTEAGI